MLAASEGRQPSAAVYTAVADRLRAALEAPDATRAQAASEFLEHIYRDIAAGASPAVQAASRGEDGGDLGMSYTLGKLAFAQLIAARVADTRANDRFVDHVRNRLYLPYLQALFDAPLTVTALQEKVGTRLETVSRKLGVLRALGLVASRKQGNEVVNMLTPATLATMDAFGLTPMREAVPTVKTPDVRDTINDERGTLKRHMQEAPAFIGRATGLAVPLHKVA